MAGSDADKQRRDLYAISTSVILFNLAGGHLKPESTTLFGAISIGRPWVLLVGAAVLWVYFLWRFLLATPNRIFNFQTDVSNEIALSTVFVAFTKQRLLRLKAHYDLELSRLSPPTPDGISQNQRVLESLAGQIPSLLRGSIVVSFERDDWLLTIDESFKHFVRGAGQVSVSQFDEGALVVARQAYPWTKWLRWRILSGAVRRATRRRNAFSDGLLPIAFAVFAPLTAALRWVWHLSG